MDEVVGNKSKMLSIWAALEHPQLVALYVFTRSWRRNTCRNAIPLPQPAVPSSHSRTTGLMLRYGGSVGVSV